MQENRKQTRSRTVLGAQIVFNNRSSTVDCKVRNMTEDGAKIVLADHMNIPQRFEFIVPQRGRTYIAKVIWRQDNEAGLEFVNEHVTAQGTLQPADMPARIRELESENALLKKRLIDLQNQIERNSMVGG